MLADDELGMTRERYENPLPESYLKAFAAIESDPNNELIVGCIGEAIVGVLQITFTPYLTHQGSWRAITDKKRDDSLRFYERLGFKVTHEGLKMKL
ncbi:hypothetical protein [Paenibacillus montaniterrae]|nr:hypothetical protein [Paenibacillus montaniterrae]